MAMYINTNVSSLNAQRNLTNSGKSLDTSYTRLASGMRINSAKDDAAGMQISNRMTSQINGLDQGNRNANDALSIAQTAEGAMDEVSGMLQRMRTLAQQSANGSNSQDDRQALQKEMDQLGTEINRISKDSTFAGQNILDGSYEGSFQVGADANQTIGFSMKLTGMADVTSGPNGTVVTPTKTDNNGFTISGIAAASGGGDKKGTIVNTKYDKAAHDAAIAASATYTVASTIDITDVFKHGGAGGIDISTQEGAQNVLAAADEMLKVVDSKRAELGAVQNRLDSTIRNQSNIGENVSAARSRIRDADFATETANMTRQNILQQAASTVLAQANQRPQSALQLMG